MPWDAATGSTTGLFRSCRVVLKWRLSVARPAIVNRSGAVTPAFYRRVVEQREIALACRPAKG